MLGFSCLLVSLRGFLSRVLALGHWRLFDDIDSAFLSLFEKLLKILLAEIVSLPSLVLGDMPLLHQFVQLNVNVRDVTLRVLTFHVLVYRLDFQADYLV